MPSEMVAVDDSRCYDWVDDRFVRVCVAFAQRVVFDDPVSLEMPKWTHQPNRHERRKAAKKAKQYAV